MTLNLPKGIIAKINFLKNNNFTVDNITEFKYSDNLKNPSIEDNIILENNINNYVDTQIKKKFITENMTNYWNNHYHFINTFEKEKELYDKYGIDSWIFYFIKNILPNININIKNELDPSFNYPSIISFEVNSNISFTPIHLHMAIINGSINNKIIIYKYITKFKWATDYADIEKTIDLITKKYKDNIEIDDQCYENIKIDCLCKTSFMERLVKYEKNTYNYDISSIDEKINHFHNKFCHIHHNYLKKYKDEMCSYEKYKCDKWMSFITKTGSTLTSLYFQNPDDCDLYLYDFIYLFT